MRRRFACLLTLALTTGLTGHAIAATAEREWREAITQRDPVALARLLHQRADPDPAGAGGVTALMVAAASGETGLVVDLLAAGADVHARNDKGASALLYAAHRGHAEVVRRLLDAGADVDVAASNGWTALTLAAATGRTETVQVLLAVGADPNHPDVYRWTPLMRAVDNGHRAVARQLLADDRTRVDLRDDAGMTALHHAARRGGQATARALAARCADPAAESIGGHTPLDILRERWGDTGEWLQRAAREANCRAGVAQAAD
ncbi:ankyrin repeat domain-containing protein [Spiribacter halobius]|uniref:Uncharacterized protein n=1 Tax=Sediminicurvatus halobius TaxID=2182432 RepID=A0A2U2MW10_9GAMM|nr:ankyrin repeat domain-containing protein [Spiribacter halobius]PWG61051.1 hypothetical protein DEM34_18390 [Spiribacter halobius]UEX76777.1 ankyrin repeat domain-containing protein [Spiribacter halobius]